MNLRASLTLSLLTLFFSTIFCTTVSGQEQAKQEKRIYIKIQVDGLSCPFCAYGLEKNLKKIEGAKDIKIDVKGGYATLNIPKENQLSKEVFVKAVKDAGFTAREVYFSETPFNKNRS